MTTRFNIPKDQDYVEGKTIDFGFDNGDIKSEFFMPSCGIEDIEASLINLFANEIPFERTQADIPKGADSNLYLIKKPNVKLAGGERFALAKLKGVRDGGGALILPIISIKRTGLEQSSEDIGGRGINQDSGNIVIKRRLGEDDREYQNLINQLGLQNIPEFSPTTTRSEAKNLKHNFLIKNGIVLKSNPDYHVWEIISIPSPQFFTMTYEVTFWAKYMEQMNHMLECLLISQLPQTKGFKLTTDKGYWFIATLDDSFNTQDNFEDFVEQEIVIKYSFTMKVKGYLFANNRPGLPVPFKKYITSTQFNLIGETPIPVEKEVVDELVQPFVLSEIEPDITKMKRQGADENLLYPNEVLDTATGKMIKVYRHAIAANSKKGETVLTFKNKQELFNFIYPVKK